MTEAFGHSYVCISISILNQYFCDCLINTMSCNTHIRTKYSMQIFQCAFTHNCYKIDRGGRYLLPHSASPGYWALSHQHVISMSKEYQPHTQAHTNTHTHTHTHARNRPSKCSSPNSLQTHNNKKMFCWEIPFNLVRALVTSEFDRLVGCVSSIQSENRFFIYVANENILGKNMLGERSRPFPVVLEGILK